MGQYSTKKDFLDKIKGFTEHGFNYFEVCPAHDCCPLCEAMANKKMAIVDMTLSDLPPYHDECLCSIIELYDDEPAEHFRENKKLWESGEFPMKRCPHCKEWNYGNAVECRKCKKNIPL